MLLQDWSCCLFPLPDELDLEDGQWEDVHVITGALKLFFRELPEPLFPYSHFNNFIAAISKFAHLHSVTKRKRLHQEELFTSYINFAERFELPSAELVSHAAHDE